MYTTGAGKKRETVAVVAGAFVGEKMVSLGPDGSLHVVAAVGTRGGTRILYLQALAQPTSRGGERNLRTTPEAVGTPTSTRLTSPRLPSHPASGTARVNRTGVGELAVSV